LLLAERLPRGQTVAGFIGLLASLGAFSLLALAARGDWKEQMPLGPICAVALQYMTFAFAAAACLAGWSCRRGFTGLKFSLWSLAWLVAVWVAMFIPLVVFDWMSGASEVGPILLVMVACFAASVAVGLPFQVLCLASPLYRRRLQGLLGAASVAPGP
jgi:hypothetical protein